MDFPSPLPHHWQASAAVVKSHRNVTAENCEHTNIGHRNWRESKHNNTSYQTHKPHPHTGIVHSSWAEGIVQGEHDVTPVQNISDINNNISETKLTVSLHWAWWRTILGHSNFILSRRCSNQTHCALLLSVMSRTTRHLCPSVMDLWRMAIRWLNTDLSADDEQHTQH